MRLVVLIALAAAALPAVEVCNSVPLYQPCEIALEMSEAEAQAHPNPYVSVELRAEFRSPDGGRTKVASGFWDGGRLFRIRFSPDYVGRWDLRILSNLESVDREVFSFQATEAAGPGFLEVFNTRYFKYTSGNEAHYWMGDTAMAIAETPQATLESIADARAEQKFNHIRGLVLGTGGAPAKAFPGPDSPNLAHFQQLDKKIAALSRRGIFFDAIFADRGGQLTELFPQRKHRERYVRYVVARLGAYRVTWQGLEAFETYVDGRKLLKEINGYVAEWDPMKHPRSTGALATSSPLAEDEWMNFIVQSTPAPGLMAIDYDSNLMPVVNVGLGSEDSGAGGGGLPAAQLRRHGWRAAVRGHNVTFANTGTDGRSRAPDARFARSPGAEQFRLLAEFFLQTRYFDLQPYYGVEGGTALSLHYAPYQAEQFKGVEYIVYQEEPQSVELILPKDGYDVSWYSPVDGAWLDQKKKYKGDRFRSPPPDDAQDWVLYVRKEEKKLSWNEKFFLEARGVKPKEIETATSEVPFEIQFPDEQALTAGQTYDFNATLTKATRSAKKMTWVWWAEVSGSGRSARVIGTDQFGRFEVPTTLTDVYPGTLSIRLLGIDGAGRLFEAFRAYRIERPQK